MFGFGGFGFAANMGSSIVWVFGALAFQKRWFLDIVVGYPGFVFAKTLVPQGVFVFGALASVLLFWLCKNMGFSLSLCVVVFISSQSAQAAS